MATLLIADPDPQLVASLRNDLRGLGHDVRTAATATDVRRILGETAVDVMLLDSGIEGAEGHSLLNEARAGAHDIRTVIALSEATAKRASSLIDRGADAVIDKPVDPLEALRVLRQVVEGHGAFRATLRGVSLIDLFQVFHLGRRSLVVHVQTAPPAEVVFVDGEIVHAQRGDTVGESVLPGIVEAQSGAMRTEDGPLDGPRSITKPFQNLLLDTLRVRDEMLRSPLDTGDLALFGDASSQDILAWQDPAPSEDAVVPDALVSPVPDVVPLINPQDAACRAVMAELPGCLAVAIIDLDEGQLLGMHHASDFSADFEEFIVGLTFRMLRGPDVRDIETRMAAARGVQVGRGPSIQELTFSTRFTHHLINVMADGQQALVVVTYARTPLMETWVALRNVTHTLDAQVRSQAEDS